MQKNKIILFSIILIIVLAILAGVYIFNKNKSFVAVENNEELQNDQNETLSENQAETNNNIAGNNQLVTDDFSMELPVGWSKIVNAAEGVSAMAANLDEIINDPAAKEINFKSYLAVSLDTIPGKTVEEYMQLIKDELQNAVSGAVFSNENNITINGRSARAVEIEMSQEGINFKVLIVAIKGNGDDVWVISYNTIKSNWDNYKEEFSDSVKSFVLKK